MILCCGEALIDMIPEETLTGAKGFVPHPGGAVFNTAISLGRLGADAGMFTGLSSDTFGALLRETLEASRVNADLCAVSDRTTTLAVVHLKDGHATYTFYDEGSAGRMLSTDDLPDVPEHVTALYFGGISLCSLPAADSYKTLCDRAGAGRVVMIDPNIRPSFITDEAAYRTRLTAMLANSDIVKISDEDLAWVIESDADLDAEAAGLCKGRTKLVILTRGADGARGFLADGRSVSVPSQRVSVVDTVGAGDSFNAGVLTSLSEAGVLTPEGLGNLSDAALTDALNMGAAVAAVTVSRAGANVPWREEVSV